MNMRKLTYLGVFEPSTDGSYGVYFPDVPGCISMGDNLDDAMKMAQEALGLHLYALEKDGQALPERSQRITIEPETNPGWIASPVTVFPDIVRNDLDNRAVKTNVTLPSWLKDLAEERGVNYSKVFQAALIDYLGVNS
jgi:predicted RNase H-like HicB family nuclease